MGRKGNQLKEEITAALADLGIDVAEANRRRTMSGFETPVKDQKEPTKDIVSTTVAVKDEVVIPVNAGRKSPARSSLIATLPPIAQRYSRSLTVDQFEFDLRTPTPTAQQFIVPHVEATPVAVAAPQRVLSNTGSQGFHRPIQARYGPSSPLPALPVPEYHTTNDQFMKQIEVFRESLEESRPKSRPTTPTSASSIPSNLRAQPRAWPPVASAAASSLARAAGLAASSLASAWSSSSSLVNNNENDNLPALPTSSPNQDSEFATAAASKRASTSSLRPLSLLQGRSVVGLSQQQPSALNQKTPTTTPAGAAKRTSLNKGVMKKRTISGGNANVSALPLGPTPRSTKSHKTPTNGPPSSKRRGLQDENELERMNRTMASAGKGSSDAGAGTPGSGLKPLRLARSATAKARGVLRQSETLPEFVVRPPSTVVVPTGGYGFAFGYPQHDVMT